ncbi:FtsQ-type POTRA domain-containing protein [Ruminococcus sp. OA3]|uniref:cell division protein FtsQ/DivIB n=1 Tax=Ruminococcus sp. OA3 TaxID=2914164 RepID=UPI001F0643F1|nr:FtsQ-type POTRA domain-containing protein [Ruminococcus sp. OA3]MCH1982306.1 FtsQ-type POTRA domain-containing protein [Ruminococcus sp. OA3]
MNTPRYRRKIGKKLLRMILGGIVLVLLIGVIVFLAVFHVKEVEVVGNTRYTTEDVQAEVLKGPFASNSFLMSVFRKKIQTEKMPFVSSIEVEMVSSHKLRLHVNEKQVIGYVRYLDCNMYFDKDGIVVESEVAPEVSDVIQAEDADSDVVEPEEIRDENETTYHAAVTDIPFITGLKFRHVVMEEKLPVENEGVFNTVLGIARIVDKYEIQPERVEFDDNYNITLYYGNIRVTLGPDTLLEEKITRVAAILPKVSGKSGVLHLEDYSKGTVNIIFTEDVPEEETDDQDKEADTSGEGEGDSGDDTSGDDITGDEDTDSEADTSGGGETDPGADTSGDEETDSGTDTSGTGESTSQNMETDGGDSDGGY